MKIPEEIENMIKIRSYPKTIFLIPTNIMSFICATMMILGTSLSWEFWTLVWFGTLVMSILIMSFDMTIIKTAAVVGGVVGATMLIFVLLVNPDIPSFITIHPFMLIIIGIVFSTIVGITCVSKLFEYYVITPSRIWHKEHWFMKVERKYDAIGSVIGIEQKDLLEKIFGDFGTLTIVTGDRNKHFVIRNVMGITKKKVKIHRLTNKMAVQDDV